MNFRLIVQRKGGRHEMGSPSPGPADENRPGIVYAGLSNKGTQRESNEDSFGVFPDDPNAHSGKKGQLFIIADGMGGHTFGKEASETAIQTIQSDYFANPLKNNSECLLQAFRRANTRIFGESKKRDSDQIMGTTCSALVLAGKTAQVAHVGDSRIYRISRDNIKQITQDHTEVIDLIKIGFLNREQAQHYPRRSALNRALGAEPEVEIEIHKDVSLREGDSFVLCTDGLAKVEPEEIKNIVQAHSVQQACRQLIELSQKLDDGDNATVIVLKLTKDFL